MYAQIDKMYAHFDKMYAQIDKMYAYFDKMYAQYKYLLLMFYLRPWLEMLEGYEYLYYNILWQGLIHLIHLGGT
jgi:hypothetical protein